MTKRLDPPNFSNPRLALVWAALSTCEPDEMLAFAVYLNEILGRGAVPVLRGKSRRADAITALREAAEILGHSPSVREYEELRKSRRDLELPVESSIRTRLGGGWNDCLGRAQLETVDELDVPAVVQPRFTEEDILVALRECNADLGEVPKVFTYRAWARRPDVQARPGKRPKTEGPMTRIYGSFPAALRAAGLASERIRRRRRVDPTEWSYQDAEIFAALRMVAERCGFSPSVKEYVQARKELMASYGDSDEALPIPAPSTITHRFRTWAAALEAAELPERRRRPYGRRAPIEPIYTDDDVLTWVARAYAEIGEPFTEAAYKSWRTQMKFREPASRIPSSWTAAARFRGWSALASRIAAEHAAEALRASAADGGGDRAEATDPVSRHEVA